MTWLWPVAWWFTVASHVLGTPPAFIRGDWEDGLYHVGVLLAVVAFIPRTWPRMVRLWHAIEKAREDSA